MTDAEGILNLILARINPLEGSGSERINPIHYQRIQNYVEKGEKIQMVLPAFPAKSSNPEKTMGRLPDMGEVLALRFLQKLCGKIGEVYAPGAEVIICSDGRVFSDLVLVEESAVTEYGSMIDDIILGFNLNCLKTFGLEDVFDMSDHAGMREELVSQFGRPVEEIQEEVRGDEFSRSLFNGIHRFVLEDHLVLRPEGSKNQISKRSKEIAYQVIQRSNAWSELVRQRFPTALRLSIHPQSPASEKLGIKLVRCGDRWRTPWHSVALFDGKNYMLVRKKDALELGARPQVFAEKYGFYSLVGT